MKSSSGLGATRRVKAIQFTSTEPDCGNRECPVGHSEVVSVCPPPNFSSGVQAFLETNLAGLGLLPQGRITQAGRRDRASPTSRLGDRCQCCSGLFGSEIFPFDNGP